MARQTASQTYFAVYEQLPGLITRLEIVFAIGLHTGLFYLLDLSLSGWLICYLSFGLHWSSLQYADHAFSVLDKTEGAWDLKANIISRIFFLNYHYHLAHHRFPDVPWPYLPGLHKADDPHPAFFRVWLSMWAGPRPLPRDQIQHDA